MSVFTDQYSDREDDQKVQLLEFVRTINRNIQPFHMEIKKGVSEEDGKSFYCLVGIKGQNMLLRKVCAKLIRQCIISGKKYFSPLMALKY